MIDVGSFVVGTKNNGKKDIKTTSHSYEYPYYIEFLYRDGSFKRGVFFGSNDNPIISMKFKINKQGPADGSIELAYIDWTINRLDIVNVYYKGTKIYHGLVNELPDLNGGEISLIPQRERLNHIYKLHKKYNENIYAHEVLREVVSEKSTEHGVYYNPDKITVEFIQKDEVQLVQPSFEDSDYESIIQQLIGQIDSDATWGVDVNNVFFVSYPDEETSKRLDQGDNPDYTEINVTTNYDNVEQTRAYVYRAGDTAKEDTDPLKEDQDVFCGTVCFEDNVEYPPQVELENEVGVIENIISISTVLMTIQNQQDIQTANNLALKYAYNKIKAQQITKTIELKNINLDKYIPECNKKIEVTKTYNQKVLWTLCECESTDNWSKTEQAGTFELSNAHVLQGKTSMCHIADPYRSLIEWDVYISYNLQHSFTFDNIEFVEMFVYAEIGGDYVHVRLVENNQQKSMASVKTRIGWNKVKIPITTNFNRIDIYYFSYSSSNKIWIDSIKIFSYTKEVYVGNITEVQYQLKTNGTSCDVTLGNYDFMVNDTLQYLEWKIKEIDNIRNISEE